MGLLAQRWEQRATIQEWLNDDDDGGRMTPSGVRVNAGVALGLSTIWRCWDLLSSAVSQAPKDVIVKIGGRSFEQFQKPSWLTTPRPDNPAYTANDYFKQITLSLLSDGNYFTWVYPHVLDPQTVTALPPSRVEVKAGPRYEVKDETGKVVAELGPLEVLHGAWMWMPGMLRGISPLEALRRSIGGAVAAEEHAARFFGQGASLSFGVEVPGGLSETQKKELSENLKRRYAGLQNSHAIGLLTGGGKFVTGLAPTPEQAQMLETRQFSVEDLCRPYGIPPHMVGSQQPGAVSYASVNGTLKEFKQFAVLPLAELIESQHNRLVSVPETVSDPNATAQFRFNLDHIERADLETRMKSYNQGILSGVLTPDEARGYEDLPPKGGNAAKLLVQSQMVPIESIGQPPAPVEQPPLRSVEELVREVAELRAPAGPEIVVNVPPINIPAPVVTINELAVPAPIVNVTVPEQPAPVVNIPEQPAPVVNIPAPVVNIDVPPTVVNVAPSPAPVVNITTPPRTKRIERDRAGNIVAVVES